MEGNLNSTTPNVVNCPGMSHNSAQRHETPDAPDVPAQNATAPPKKATRNLRESMPQVAAFIDEMRAAFGAEEINAQIKLGMQGAQTFHAAENGHEVGTRFDAPVKYITADRMVIRANHSNAERRPGADVSREAGVSGSSLKNRTPRKA